MKRIVSVMAFVAIALMIIPQSGCSSKKKVELTMWCSSQDVLAVTREFADTFIDLHKNEADITINLGVESEETAANSIALNPENAADIFCVPDDQLIRLYSLGALLPISYDKNQVMETCGGADGASIRCASVNGELYGIPLTAGNGYFLFYNDEYFTDEDVATLDRILEIADENDKYFIMDYSSGWYTYSFFGGAGLSLDLSEDGKSNVCNWNATDTDITGVQVAEAMMDISAHPGFKNGGDGDFLDGIRSGSVIAGVSGTWNTMLVQEAWGDNMRAVKLPTYTVAGRQVQMASFIGYKLAAVNAYTDEPEWAQRFAEYMLDYDNQMRRYREFGEIPTNSKAVLEPDVINSPVAKAITDQSEFATQQRVTEAFWNPMTSFGTVMAAGNADSLDLQALLDRVVREITEPVNN